MLTCDRKVLSSVKIEFALVKCVNIVIENNEVYALCGMMLTTRLGVGCVDGATQSSLRIVTLGARATSQRQLTRVNMYTTHGCRVT